MRYRDNPLIEQRYNCEKWKKVRKLKRISVNGLCERCYEEGKITPGKIVHHREHITDENYMDDDLMYGLENLEFLCDKCHKIEHGSPEDYYFDEEGNLWQRKQT